MTRRFYDGWTGIIDGVRLRVRKGKKAPDDLVMEMSVDGEWRFVKMSWLAVMVDFMCENEDYLYPSPRRGGWKTMDMLVLAKMQGHTHAIEKLEAEKAEKRLREQQEATG